MSATIWVVEQGCYSDYLVVGVFSSKENAEIVASKINAAEYVYDQATVAEWPLDPAISEINNGMKLYSIMMLKDGTSESVKESEFNSYNMGGEFRIWERSKTVCPETSKKPDCLTATVWATSSYHAIKIANEKRAQMIASGEWK